MELVSVRQLSKTYRMGSVEVNALQDVNVEIRANCFTVISGASGSGKTTLLNLIGCIDRPTQGRVEVDGRDVATMTEDALADFRAQTLGYVFQHFNLLPVLSAAENIEYPLVLTGMPARQRRQRVQALLRAVDLDARGDSRPTQLSGGQRQRVAIARALAARPRLVLADEPTANLDSATGAAILALMRSLQAQEGVSFVFSSHDRQVLASADDTICLCDGRITALQRGTRTQAVAA